MTHPSNINMSAAANSDLLVNFADDNDGEENINDATSIDFLQSFTEDHDYH